LNHTKLKLSKQLGLIQTLGFYSFDKTSFIPPAIYTIAGISLPEAGLQNLSKREVYAFKPGDEFQTEYGYDSYIWTSKRENSVNLVLSGNWSPGLDSVTNTIKRFRHQWGYDEMSISTQYRSFGYPIPNCILNIFLSDSTHCSNR